MSEGQLENLNALKSGLKEIEQGIVDDENEIQEIIKRMPNIRSRQKELDEIIETLVYKRDSLEVLLSEIDKGFDKVQASVKSLYLLALSKSKILKRKYSKFT
jgi:chromosome segregation ATPase